MIKYFVNCFLEIDDCADPDTICLGKHTHCENTPGDYICVCNKGFWEHPEEYVCYGGCVISFLLPSFLIH